MDVLRDNPELEPFVLSNVRFTGTPIGAGAYGSVEEVAIPGAICAAKKIHDFFHDTAQLGKAEILKATTQFVKECQLMSTLRHPNIVQFLGVCFFPGSRLPALVMERLLTSLHDLLDPQIDPPPPPDAPKPFFPLSLKCSILHNVASGLDFLHEQTPPIIHRDLSARNVLLNSGMVAKIADLGVARIAPHMRAASAATMTRAPGASVYMPPEAIEDKPRQKKEEEAATKYNTSIDVFSFGVVSIFTLSQTFPCQLLAPNYRNEQKRFIARTELERREHYMKMIYSQLKEQHPLLQMIERCLDFPEDRPSIGEVLFLLEQARAEERDKQMEMNKLELIQALRTQPRSQSLECDLQSHVQEETDLLQQPTRVEEREQQQLQVMRQQVTTLQQQLTRKEAELITVDETFRREQQQRLQIEVLVQAKDRELAQSQQRLREKEEQLRSSEAVVAEFQKHSEPLRTKTQGAVLTPQTSTSSASQSAHQSTLRAVPHSVPIPEPKKLTVQCHRKNTAPYAIHRGSATTDHQFSYFRLSYSNSVYRYQWSTEKWEELPPCPHPSSGLVIIDGDLTAVGGVNRPFFTNKLFTLLHGQWFEKYPPMNTPRSSATIVSISDGEYVLVIGGLVKRWFLYDYWTTNVELFQVRSRSWQQLKELPQPLPCPSATVCGDQVHVLGWDGNGYLCSLLSSGRPATTQSVLRIMSWTALPHPSLLNSTAATLSGQLVIIGGWKGVSPIKTIHQLFYGQWLEIGSIWLVVGVCVS